MRVRRLAGAVVAAALVASTFVAPALAAPALADNDPSLTITGVVAIVADVPEGDAAYIVAGNTMVSVGPDAVAELAPGTTVEAELTIPGGLAKRMNVAGDVDAASAAGKAIVAEAEQPFAVESLETVQAAAAVTGVHYIDVAVNTKAYSGAVRPTEAQVRAAIADASAYWSRNTNGALTGFQIRHYVTYSSSLSCAASDDAWWSQAAKAVGVSLNQYLATASGQHLVLIGECSNDAKAALGTVGDSLGSGGLVLTQADVFSSTGLLAYLNGLLIHELGHNFGLMHANGPNLAGCDLLAVPAYTEITRCGTADYADDYSLMGYGMPMSYAPLLDVARRDQLGLMDSSTLATQSASTQVTHTLTALGASGGLKGVKVSVPSGTYFVEYRNATDEPGAYYLRGDGCTGEWEPSPTCTSRINPYGPGVRVMLRSIDGSTRAEAVRTQTQSATFAEFGLDAGDWWISNAGDVFITVDAISGDAATVTVRTGATPRASISSAVLSSAPTLGTPVSVTVGTVTPAADLTYRWFRNGVEIAGASGASYTPVLADAGTTLSARVEARANGYAPTQRVTAGRAVAPGKPALAAAPKVGVPLGVTTGTWPDGFAFTYQWLRGGAVIAGATQSTYTPVVADYGKSLSVRVTAAHPGLGSVALTSTASTVAKGTRAAPKPSITGTAWVGRTLTAARGSWPSGTTFTYRWYANGKAISGATKSTYKVTSAMVGKKITVKVTGAPPGYNAASATSAARGVPVVGKVTVTGRAKVGSTLAAHHGTWTSGTSFAYQWYANGVAIKGATKAKYKVTSARVGKTITVKVTGRKAGYQTVVKSSAKTAKVKR